MVATGPWKSLKKVFIFLDLESPWKPNRGLKVFGIWWKCVLKVLEFREFIIIVIMMWKFCSQYLTSQPSILQIRTVLMDGWITVTYSVILILCCKLFVRVTWESSKSLELFPPKTVATLTLFYWRNQLLLALQCDELAACAVVLLRNYSLTYMVRVFVCLCLSVGSRCAS